MNFSTNSAKFVVLAVLDGWGIAPASAGNAITQANTPNIDRFWLSCPHTQLNASGESVGLPRGEPGSTETGHLNLGAGRIVFQELERINMSIAEGTFFENKALLAAVEHSIKNNSNLHLMGLVGAGGVHSNIEHLFALIRLAKQKNLKKLYLHLFTDGRDSPPTAANAYIAKIKEVIIREGIGKIASVMGRYWSMDRDCRWERTSKAYFALTKGEGLLVTSAEEAVKNSYARDYTDEFIKPALISLDGKKPIATISENDSVIFFNFRIDRPRQLTKAFVLDDFSLARDEKGFDPYTVKYEHTHIRKETRHDELFARGDKIKNLHFVMMTEYSKPLVDAGAKVAFPPEIVKMPLGQTISLAGMRQLRMAESEKERFVTIYFNGLREMPYSGEERIITPSLKVPTYDQKPEMSAEEMTEKLLNELKEFHYQFILVNFANPDMVGHTGNLGPAITACEVVDKCVGKIANFVLAYEGVLLITADHGNVEEMINLKSGEVNTEHSNNPVPFIVISKGFLGKSVVLPSGILADVAPTILSLLDVPIPGEMTGRNLLSDLSRR